MHQMPSQLPAFMHALAPIIDKYGYVGVGTLVMLEDFGVPVPGETVLVAAAFFAALGGSLNIFLVAAVGFVAAVIGDNIGFAIGKYGGHPLVERFGRYIFLTPARIAKVERFFRRYGGSVVVIARFVEGLRQFNGIVAGLSEMPWPAFLAFNTIAAALWVAVWSSVGYFGGNHIETFLKYQLYLAIVSVVALAIFVGYKLAVRKRSK
jgi:membrane protein DedA with SNARE-associated domain